MYHGILNVPLKWCKQSNIIVHGSLKPKTHLGFVKDKLILLSYVQMYP